MSKIHSRHLAGAFLGVLLTAAALAQNPPTPLPPYLTTATRTPAEPRTLGSAVDFISADDLARRQITSLGDALGGSPGAPAFASGSGGGVT
jgi:outer membrane receptor protein involved in Fe transport